MEFSSLIKKRKSIRRLSSKKIEKEKLDKILQETNSAPSAKNLQSYKVYLIEKQEVKEELTLVSGGQGVITQAPAVLVFCADVKQGRSMAGERGEDLYSLQDATIACTFAWLAAVDQGLASVWIGAFDEEQVIKILNLDKGLRPVAILPLGYAAEKPPFKPKKDLNEIVVRIE